MERELTEEILDVRSMLRILWRFRILLAAAALLGAVLGAVYAAANPPAARSTALVLLPPAPASGSDQSAHDPATEVAIATSTPVLAQAGRRVTPHASARALRRVTSARSLTPDIIEVEVSAASTARARALTDGPLYAGFGISTGEHARAAAVVADGVVVGSRAVEAAEQGPAGLAQLVRELRSGLDG